MKVWASAEVLSEREMKAIDSVARRVLAEVGVKVEHERVRERLLSVGGVEGEDERVRFPQDALTKYLESVERFDWEKGEYCEPEIGFGAGAYPRTWHDPDEEAFKPQTLSSVSDLTRLADRLENITGIGAMGVPTDVPGELSSLYMKLIAWRDSVRKRSGSYCIWGLRLVPYAVRMAEVMAAHEGGETKDYMSAGVFLISPLRFARIECEQFLALYDKSFHCWVGSMLSAGGTAPATLAGALALDIAEHIFRGLLMRAFYGAKGLYFGASISIMDMRHGFYPYGRPEFSLCHLAEGQMARYYGAAFSANSFLGDEKNVGALMGMEKAMNAVCAVLAGTSSIGTLGLLSVDEICSPILLILDDEYAGSLKRLARGFEVNEETLAFDVLKAVGPGGNFLAEEHTVRHFRREHWEPRIQSRESYSTWLAQVNKTDYDKALDIWHEVLQSAPERGIKEETERELLRVIEEARADILG